MENIMLETALRYAKLGISVIPVSRDKAPLIEFADREPLTEEEIISIWTQNPTANIAMKCDKFVVVDVDVHNDVLKCLMEALLDFLWKGDLDAQEILFNTLIYVRRLFQTQKKLLLIF
ncbi:bifunctional DNA primase/polymerase [Lactococcus petauri]|uniref:bifunctional DNA primase/polymerase n=1 Tax=Lactococcus petauri TaxID=1940789 RepID=UPI0038547A24